MTHLGRSWMWWSVASLPWAVGCGGNDGADDPTVTLYALMHNLDLFAADAEVEIVDLGTRTRVGGFALPDVNASSLAVSPDGATLYIADAGSGAILVRDAAGAPLPTIAQPGVRDLALSADGTRLWAAGSGLVALYDTGTHALLESLPLTTGEGFALALSPDETTLAWPAWTAAGAAINGIYLAPAATLATATPVPLTGGPGVFVYPSDVRFASDDLLLVWDNNNDTIHHVDVPSALQLPLGTTSMTADGGASFNSNNALQWVDERQKLYGFKESGEAWVYELATGTATPLGGFTRSPFLPVADPDGRTVYYGLYPASGPSALDVLETTGDTFTRSVYTFTSTYAPRDGVILRR